jgi:hypothetical protein
MKIKLSKPATAAFLFLFLTECLLLAPLAASDVPPVFFSRAKKFALGFNAASVEVGDFNGDGNLDLAVANFNSGKVSILLGAGDGTFGAAMNLRAGSFPYSVVVDGNKVLILLGAGDGTFKAAKRFALGVFRYL